MSYLLAFDQSTSGTKAPLFDYHAQLIDSESLPHRQIYPQPGWVEHDAEQIWQNLCQAAKVLLDRRHDLTQAVRGISITNQRETIVVFDRDTGLPIGPAIVWQCRRSADICGEMIDAGHEELITQKTGLKLDAYFSATKIAWIRRAHPEIAARIDRGDALVGTIDTYLVYRLTGGQVFATDHTNASRTLFFNLHKRSWDRQLCELFEVPIDALAEVRESFASFGNTDLCGLLPERVPIHGIMGDSQASLFAQCCFEPGQTKATFGTGTSVMMNTGDKCMTPDNGLVAALAWVRDGTPTYAVEGLINYSAATISWLKNQLGLIAAEADCEKLANAVDSCEGVYLVPAFSGMGAPYWRPEARAAIVGMTAFTRKEHVVRAALESIAYQINDVLQAISGTGVAPRRIHADGGATQNALLMQMVADTTRLEIVATVAPDNSARGVAMSGLFGLGVVDSLEQLSELACASVTYLPKLNPTIATSRIAGWHSAVQRVF